MSGMTSAIGSVVLSSTSSNGVARGLTTDDGTRRGANAVESAETASSVSALRMFQHCTVLSALHSKEQMMTFVQQLLQEQPAIARMRSCSKLAKC